MRSAPGRGVEAKAGGLGSHPGGVLVQGEEHADLVLLSIEQCLQIADERWSEVTGLDREDNLLDFTPRVIVDVDAAVDALVKAILASNCRRVKSNS